MHSTFSDLDVWVLAGQSNMQGFAWRQGALAPDPMVRVFSSAGAWDIAEEPLHRLWESFTPVNQELMRPGLAPADKDLTDAEIAHRESREGVRGAGLGLSFGIAMARETGRQIGLIPAAHDGSRLIQWSESGKSLAVHSLYGAMLERIARAGGRLRGLLWYQGESDAHDMEASRSYAQRLDRWIAALRADTGLPELPVVAVQIGRALAPKAGHGQFPGWDLVREAIATLPERTRVTEIEPWTAPTGGCNALRVRFEGVTNGWTRTDAIQGFTVHPAHGSSEAPPFLINAWVDEQAKDESVILLLTRPLAPGERLGYGVGTDPRCDLVDGTDMPLCSFLPRDWH